MGNRAVIAIKENKNQSIDSCIGIYLHWNGGRDSVEGFLLATKKVMESRGEDSLYATGRLIQVIGQGMGGNMSFGVGLCSTLDTDNGDNGTFVVNPATLEITEQLYSTYTQAEYDVNEFANETLKELANGNESYKPLIENLEPSNDDDKLSPVEKIQLTIDLIQNNKVYKQILSDSHGGVMYLNSPSDYETVELNELMSVISTDQMDGIMKGVYHFINN